MRVSLSPHSMPGVDQAIRVNSVIDPMVPDKRACYVRIHPHRQVSAPNIEYSTPGYTKRSGWKQHPEFHPVQNTVAYGVFAEPNRELSHAACGIKNHDLTCIHNHHPLQLRALAQAQ